jgi:hypothetical protein
MDLENMCPSKPTPEKEFAIVVLSLAKDAYGNDAKYLNITRMVKLVALVADRIGYDLTRGWYKYGFYSPTAWEVAQEYTMSESANLILFEPPKELITKLLEKFTLETDSIVAEIDLLKEFFIQDKTNFFDWVYGTTTPKEYRKLYLMHRNFQRYIDDFIRCLNSPDVFNAFLDKLIPRMEDLVSQYYESIGHIKDEGVLDLFYDYMDLLEMVSLKIANKKYQLNEEELFLLGELKDFYLSDVDLWLLLVPYSETLVGPIAQMEQERHAEKISASKKFLEVFLQKLFDDTKKRDLLPSIEEQGEKIRRLGAKYPGRKPLREVYGLF